MLQPRREGRERRRSDALRAAAGAAGLAVTSMLAATDHVSALEREAFDAVNHLPHTVAPELWVVMQAGSFPAVFVTAGLALVARRPRLAVALATAGTATWLLAKVVKQVVDRGRPETFLHDVVVYGPAASGLGFPSGHAAVAACLMTVAAPYLTRPARVIGWVVVGAGHVHARVRRRALPAGRRGRSVPGLDGRQHHHRRRGQAGRHDRALAAVAGGACDRFLHLLDQKGERRLRARHLVRRQTGADQLGHDGVGHGAARANRARPAGVMRAQMTRLSLGHGARSANPRASRRSTRRVTPALLTSSRAPMSFMRRRPSAAASRPDSTSNSSSEMSISLSSRALRVSCSTRPARTIVAHKLRNSCGDLAVSLRLMASAYPCFMRDYHG